MSPPLPLYPVYSRDCVGSGTNAQRPCRNTWCRYHLEHNESGGVLRHQASVARRQESGETETCSLDVASQRGPIEIERIGELLGMTKQRVDQILRVAIFKLKKRARKLRG